MAEDKKMYRVGIIGCGRMASTMDEEKSNQAGRVPQPVVLAGAYRQVGRTGVVAAADINGDRLEDFSARWGVDRLYADYRDMLEVEDLDIVSVATHAHLHSEMTVAAAEAGVKAVLCEKAMATSLPDADRMIEACREAGTTLSVLYHNRWDPLMVRVKELVAGGTIGELISIAGNMGPELVHEASHMFDLMRFWSGDEVAWVFGQLDGSRESHEDPGGSGYLQFQNGMHAFVNAVTGCPVGFEFDLVGTKGRIRVGYNVDELWTVEEGVYEGSALVGRKVPQNIEARSGVVKAIEELVECIEQDKAPSCTGQDGRKALEVALAFHISHQEGGAKVTLPLEDTSLTVTNPRYYSTEERDYWRRRS